MSLQKISPYRYQVYKGVSSKDLQSIGNDSQVKMLQFSEQLAAREIIALEKVIFSRRPDIALRLFSFPGTCDLGFLDKIPSARHIQIEDMDNVTGMESLSAQANLSSLVVNVHKLESFAFLKEVSDGLNELYLVATVSKKPSLRYIDRFKKLRILFLEGHQKDIEAVQKLKALEKIVLRSISTRDVDYLKDLDKLWSVNIKLGSIHHFDALSTLPSLKYLELWQIKGLSDLSFISSLYNLQFLFIQSLKQVTALPPMKKLVKLRRLHIENMNGLTDIAHLQTIPALQDFIYLMAKNREPEFLLPVLKNKSVRNVLAGFSSDKKEHLFYELAEKFGKKQFSFDKFRFEK